MLFSENTLATYSYGEPCNAGRTFCVQLNYKASNYTVGWINSSNRGLIYLK